MSERCSTRSGPYRCTMDVGHGGECEAEDVSRSTKLGPYPDAARARAYLRGMIDAAGGRTLDAIGGELGVRRATEEADLAYRERLWSTPAR